MKHIQKYIIAVFLVVAMVAVAPTASLAATFTMQKTRSIVFPVIGATSYINDWHYPRSGHLHQGNDVFGYKGQPLVATVDGTVRFVPYPQPSYGYMVSIEDAEGYQYWYLHINNDNPGTDDGQGGGMNAYAPGMEPGATVKAGQLIGWMGDSGNAESTRSHVHFELHEPDGDAINPFFSLQAARHISRPVAPVPQANEMFPFGGFTGGASVAVGDVDPDVDGEEVVVGAAAGGGPSVAVYNGTTNLAGFFAYPSGFRGGVDVATGDIDGDGADEILTAAGPGGAGEVHIYGPPGTLKKIVFPYSKFNGELRIAAADLDGDGLDEIIVGPGRGGGPEVRVLDGTGRLRARFMAYATTFRGGIDVTAFSATETQPGGIVTVPLTGGGPHVKTFYADGVLRSQFFAYRKEYRGGVHVSAAIVSGEPSIVTVPMANDNADIRTYTIAGQLTNTQTEFEEWWRGGYDIAAGDSGVLAISTMASKRRTAVRYVKERNFSFFDDENLGTAMISAVAD